MGPRKGVRPWSLGNEFSVGAIKSAPKGAGRYLLILTSERVGRLKPATPSANLHISLSPRSALLTQEQVGPRN